MVPLLPCTRAIVAVLFDLYAVDLKGVDRDKIESDSIDNDHHFHYIDDKNAYS